MNNVVYRLYNVELESTRAISQYHRKVIVVKRAFDNIFASDAVIDSLVLTNETFEQFYRL
jgi:hypothetical protein